MIIRKTYADMMKPLTDEELAEIEALKDIEPEPDEDSPAYSLEELREMKRITEERKAERNKQSVTLRLSPATLAKARSLGKGYTSILSRIIENALNDPETLRNSL
ncbi:MAG: BrnA antitoxin family protein [Ruminiclostridium sp.]|nr:BrnA antitoxin family protein [Ruminiclostridium sp.]